MKPIRSNELGFFNKIIEDKFYDMRQTLETEITSEAQKLADKKSPTMAKQCGVDGDLKKLKLADEKYKAFILSKISTENKLLADVRDQMSKIQSKLERMSKARGWERSFDGYDAREDGATYFEEKLDSACYDEAYKFIKSNHKVYNDLRDKKSACEIILHTGSDINSTVSTLQKEMKTVNIDLPVPNHLLQLAVK
tara:strand:+ start:41 stop:625 length:585 start_codon:yes stop_codon:yes gene_type:complete